jgi:hypothetical protein
MKLIGFGERMFVIKADIEELMAIQTQINNWLEIMKEDTHFAVPEFMLEQLWNRLDYVISSNLF